MNQVSTTDVAAVGAVASPLWLHSMSDVAVIALPILGCTWLIIQITLKILPLLRRNK